MSYRTSMLVGILLAFCSALAALATSFPPQGSGSAGGGGGFAGTLGTSYQDIPNIADPGDPVDDSVRMWSTDGALAWAIAGGSIYAYPGSDGVLTFYQTDALTTRGDLEIADLNLTGFTDYQDMTDPGVPGINTSRVWGESGSIGLATPNGTAYLEVTADGIMDLGSTPGAQNGTLNLDEIIIGASGTGYRLKVGGSAVQIVDEATGATLNALAASSVNVGSNAANRLTSSGVLVGDGSNSAWFGVDGAAGRAFLGTASGGTGNGVLEVAYVSPQGGVEANTAGSGAPNTLAATESGAILTNEGSTAENYHTLPTAAAGLRYTFVCQDADGIRATANTGDTIRLSGSVSATAGYVNSTTIGSSVTLVAINATEWIAIEIVGTWAVN